MSPWEDIAFSSAIGLSSHLITFNGAVAPEVAGLLTAAA